MPRLCGRPYRACSKSGFGTSLFPSIQVSGTFSLVAPRVGRSVCLGCLGYSRIPGRTASGRLRHRRPGGSGRYLPGYTNQNPPETCHKSLCNSRRAGQNSFNENFFAIAAVCKSRSFKIRLTPLSHHFSPHIFQMDAIPLMGRLSPGTQNILEIDKMRLVFQPGNQGIINDGKVMAKSKLPTHNTALCSFLLTSDAT